LNPKQEVHVEVDSTSSESETDEELARLAAELSGTSSSSDELEGESCPQERSLSAVDMR
jgi:hypothetical protein